MRIRGAVLHELGAGRPYRDSCPLQIEEMELSPPGPTEILVRVEVAGLCHSDLSVVDGTRPRPVPLLIGHESAGIVEAVGSDVTDLTIGQRVTMTFLPRCNSCRACRTDGRIPCIPGSAANGRGELLAGGTRLTLNGRPVFHHLGVSAFAEYAVVDRRSVVPVGDHVPPAVAALLGCAVLTGGGAVLNVGKPVPGDTVAVVGLGGVGMAAVLTALSEPDVHVVAVDTSPAKLAAARRLGAHTAVSPSDAIGQEMRAHAVIEAAGNAAAFETAVELTAVGGRTVTVGLPSADALARVSPLRLVAEGRSIVGSYLGSALPARDIPAFIDRWRLGRLPIERLISGVNELDDINTQLDALAAGSSIRELVELSHG